MKKRFRNLLRLRPVLLLATLALAIAAAIAVRLRMPVAVETVEVDRGTVVDEVLGVGTVESDDEIRAAFTVTGRLVELRVDEGDEVRTGDTLASIDVEATTREVEMARAGELEADAAIRRAIADRDKARSALESAKRERARTEALASAGAASHAERDAATDREALAKSDLLARDAALTQALAAREVAKRTTGSRQAHAQDGLLTSPIDGIVVRRHVDPGVVVTPGLPVLTLVSPERVRVRAWVDETALGRVAKGQRARLSFRSEPQRDCMGTVIRVGRTVDGQTHEFLVDLRLDDAPESLAIGQRVDAWIAVSQRDDVVRVPRGFCEEGAGKCFVVRDERAVETNVSFGLVGRSHIELASGLEPADRIVRPVEPGAGLAGRRVRNGGTP